jgi:hypothetical protein
VPADDSKPIVPACRRDAGPGGGGTLGGLRVLMPPTGRWVHISGDGARCPPYARPSEDQEKELSWPLLLAATIARTIPKATAKPMLYTQ